MRIGKKAAAIIGLAAGVSILATSAFADTLLGSGYDSLKTAVKTTSKALSKDLNSFTADMSLTMKMDGASFGEVTATRKFDVQNNKSEATTKSWDRTRTNNDYYYADNSKTINKDSKDEIYYLYEYENEDQAQANSVRLHSGWFGTDLSDDEKVADLEKIMDAMVGNLKDLVQVEETDGKRMYSGSLRETQVPPLINAVTSFAVKYGIMNERTMEQWGIPMLKSDISVSDVTGKAVANADGILESVVGSGSLVGKDKDGVLHTISGEVTLSLYDINSTVVNEPDLTGKQVERIERKNESGWSKAYIGTYKSDMIARHNDAFVKTGERVVEITSVENDQIIGSYTERFADGYKPQEGVRSFTFTAVPDKGNYGYRFSYTDVDGTRKNGFLSRGGQNICDVRVSLDVEFAEDGGYSYSGNEVNVYIETDTPSTMRVTADESFARVFD